MAVLLRPKQWTRQQPHPAPRINWNHPLAQGLKVCLWATGTGVPVDLVSGKRATATGLGQAPTEIGHAQKLDGSTSGFNLPVDLSGTNKVTLGTWLYPESAAALSVLAELTANYNTDNALLISFASTLNGSGTDIVVGSHSTGTANYISYGTPDPTLNRLTHVACKIDRSTPTATGVSYNGIAQPMTANSGVSNAAQAENFVNSTLYIGARAGTSFFLQGRIPLLTVHTRILTDSEIQRLYTEPYGFLHPQSPRQRYWITSASTVSYPTSLADTISISDSVARTVTDPRALSDTVVISDTVSRTDSAGRPVSDTVPVSDALARTAADPRALADTVPISDSLGRLVSVPRTLADTIPVSDTVAVVATGRSRLADTVPVSETVLRTLADARALADLIAISDTLDAIHGTTAPTPAARIYHIPAENRVYLVPAENRTYRVPAENRVMVITP